MKIETVKRNYGIDLIRILAMFMVLLLHIIGQGMLYETALFSLRSSFVWLIYIGAYCAVNLYALITGYVMYESRFQLKRLIALWLEVLFYSVIITLLMQIFVPDAVQPVHLVSMFFPLLSDSYWYFTAYFALFFLIPFLNPFLQNLNKSKFQLLIFILVFLFSVLPTLAGKDLFSCSFGYSTLWLGVMYTIGAYIKKYRSCPKQKGIYILVYFFSIVLMFGSKLLLGWFELCGYSWAPDSELLIKYTSPFVLLCAICLFEFFRNLHIKNNFFIRLIHFFAPVSFGVYLIHIHPLVFSVLLYNRFTGLATLPPLTYVAIIAGTSVGVYLVCSVIDYLRIKLFKFLHVSALAQNLDALLMRIYRHFSQQDTKSVKKGGENSNAYTPYSG